MISSMMLMLISDLTFETISLYFSSVKNDFLLGTLLLIGFEEVFT